MDGMAGAIWVCFASKPINQALKNRRYTLINRGGTAVVFSIADVDVDGEGESAEKYRKA
jgi:hypothetical protein